MILLIPLSMGQGLRMDTLRQFATTLQFIPAATGWHLADLGEAIGKQQLLTKQAPQRLKTLHDRALIESAVSSNRVEGVEVDGERILTLVFDRPTLRDRNEEEFRGYREALDLIHSEGARLRVSEQTIRRMHKMIRGHNRDAGRYAHSDANNVQPDAGRRKRSRFESPPARRIPAAMKQLVSAWDDCLRQRRVHPLVATAAFHLDFLCIHPFLYGNGRVSRLLLLQQCYHQGIEVGRYMSLERVTEQNQEQYDETLEHSSRGWQAGKHDPWPFINHVLFILTETYKQFEQRLERADEPPGTKTELVLAAIRRQQADFTVADMERACPSVRRDMIRWVLRVCASEGRVECRGRGPGALWRRKGGTSKKE